MQQDRFTYAIFGDGLPIPSLKHSKHNAQLAFVAAWSECPIGFYRNLLRFLPPDRAAAENRDRFPAKYALKEGSSHPPKGSMAERPFRVASRGSIPSGTSRSSTFLPRLRSSRLGISDVLCYIAAYRAHGEFGLGRAAQHSDRQ
jgi:hypothetical protein